MTVVLLLAGLALAGCKSMSPAQATRTAMDETRAQVTASVADPTKAERMQTLINALEADLEAYAEIRDAHNRALAEANADYDTSREDMQSLYDTFNQDARGMLEKLTGTHLELKALATEAEWAAISGHKHRVGGI